MDEMRKIKVIAFDCDGVMFDSEKANIAFYDRILNHVGKPGMTPEQFAYVHMHTVDEALAFLFPDEKIRQQADAYRVNASYFDLIKMMEIEPCLKDLLSKIRPHIKTAVATNRTNTMGQVLDEHGLADMFDLVVCAMDVARPKPDPEMLLRILEYFDAAPDEALYVGDSELDALASKAAEIPLVAYDNPALSATFHITSLRELEEILY